MSPAPYSAELRSKFRSQLANRRARLEKTIAALNQPADLLLLLNEVDAALSRLDGGSYGECAVCHTEIAAGDLLANPTASYCLCELSPERQRVLERDLTLAWRLADGDSIVLYTDGVTEAANAQDHEYGDERLRSLLACCGGKAARDLVTRCLADVSAFLDGNALSDDLTMLALQRSVGKAS